MSDTIIECKAKLRCKDCLYFVHHEGGPRCHIARPTCKGYPKIEADSFCGVLTIPETMERPYFKLFTSEPEEY